MTKKHLLQPARPVGIIGYGAYVPRYRLPALEGIQRGHMSLHARQVAIAAGASGEMVEQVAAQMVAEGMVRVDRAEEILIGYENAKKQH